MKRIYYDKENQFILTDNEEAESKKAFALKMNYYCPRIKATITPFFKFIDTPKKILYLIKTIKMKEREIIIKNKYFKDDEGNIFQIDGESLFPIFLNDSEKEELEKNLLTEDQIIEGVIINNKIGTDNASNTSLEAKNDVK